jgi:carboxymethylenebutenolidase
MILRALALVMAILWCLSCGATAGYCDSQVTFRCGGKVIHMDRFEPPGRGRHPAILLLHGAGGHQANQEWLQSRTRELVDQGYAVFFPHYFDRTNTSTANPLTVFKNLGVWKATVREAISSVAADPRVKPDRIGVLGLSLGGIVALAAATEDSRVKVVVEQSGRFLAPYDFRASKMPPVLILHGAEDNVVSVSQAYRLRDVLKRNGRPYEIQVYPGQGHGFHGDAVQDSSQRMVRFFGRYLK